MTKLRRKSRKDDCFVQEGEEEKKEFLMIQHLVVYIEKYRRKKSTLFDKRSPTNSTLMLMSIFLYYESSHTKTHYIRDFFQSKIVRCFDRKENVRWLPH